MEVNQVLLFWKDNNKSIHSNTGPVHVGKKSNVEATRKTERQPSPPKQGVQVLDKKAKDQSLRR